MCWSGEASACLAATGFISTAYFFRQGESKTLCMALGYFSLMELLQAYTYTVIDQCANPRNQVATLLGYIHITFQPFFINAVAMHFLPEHVRKQIATWVYALCGIAAMIFIMRIYPFAWAEFCYEKSYQLLMGAGLIFDMPFCGREICSTSGSWHIAWAIPANGSIEMANAYVYAAFLLPLLYGSWKLVVYHLITGPILAFLTTDNMNEWAAVWCLYSIGLLLLLIKTPIRNYLHIKNWYGLAYPVSDTTASTQVDSINS